MKISQDQFILALVILALLFLWLFLRRFEVERLKPSKLDMQKGKKMDIGSKDLIKTNYQVIDPVTREQRRQSQGKARDLNARFIYNGHTFDAYEVLGLPAGASKQKIQEAFQKSKAEVNKGNSTDLIELAFKVLTQYQEEFD